MQERSAVYDALSSAPSDVGRAAGRAVKRCGSFALQGWIAALFAPLAVLASRKVQTVLLAVVMLNFPLRISKHFFFREDALVYGSVSGLDISLGTIALAGLYLGRMLDGQARARWRDRDRIGTVVLLVFLAYAISSFAAEDVTLAVFDIWGLLESTLLYFFIARVASGRKEAAFIMRLLMAGLIIENLIMLAQAAGLINISAFGLKTAFEGDRIPGTFGSPNSAGCYLAMMMVISLGIVIPPVSQSDKGVASLALALSVVPLVLAASRTGWVSFITGLVTIAIVGRKRLAWKPVIAVLMIVILLMIPFAGNVRDRLTEDDNGAAASRIPLNRLAWLIIQDHPLFGVGANNFAVAMEPYVTKGFLGEFVYAVHNRYLLFWAETGLIGFIVFVGLLLATVIQAWRCANSSDRFVAGMALGVMAATVALATDMVFDLCREGPTFRSLWLYAGLITAMTRMSKSNANADAAAETSADRSTRPGSMRRQSVGKWAPVR